jgi:hypothetical protein
MELQVLGREGFKKYMVTCNYSLAKFDFIDQQNSSLT